MSPAVSGGLIRFYFDPIRSLSDAAAEAWASDDARKSILASIAAKAAPSTTLLVANGAQRPAQGKRMRRSPAPETTRRPSPHQGEVVHDSTRGKEPLRIGAMVGNPAAEAHSPPSA
jgi:hypothetical protein